MFNPWPLFLFLILFCGCSKEHLYVQQQLIDEDFLASVHVDTPDPRLENPPFGQRLLVSWDFPVSLYRKGLSIKGIVRFFDQSEEEIFYKITQKRGSTYFNFPMDQENPNKILSYKMDVVTSQGEIIETWTHVLWAESIKIP